MKCYIILTMRFPNEKCLDMPRDVITVEEEDEESMHNAPEGGSEDSDNPESSLTKVAAGDTVNFMHDPVRKQTARKVVRKKRLTKKEERSKRKTALEKTVLGLVKPDAATDREKERYLRKIATKGVVQLFNAVAERQRTMSKTLQQKMTAKQRNEAREKFKGNQFDVYQDKIKTEDKDDVKEEEDDDNLEEEEESFY